MPVVDLVKEAVAAGSWKEKKDEKSGRTYYYNTQQKSETSWNLDKTLRDLFKVDPVKAGGYLGWHEKKDEKSGKTYFYNKKTQKTTWDLLKELGVDSEDSSSSSSSSKAKPKTVEEVLKSGEWVEKKDEKSGKNYYYQPSTKKTTWNLEKELGIDKVGGGGGDKKTLEDFLVPNGPWVEKLDEGSGKKFYYHKETKKTVWANKIYKELGIEPPSTATSQDPTPTEKEDASAAAATTAAETPKEEKEEKPAATSSLISFVQPDEEEKEWKAPPPPPFPPAPPQSRHPSKMEAVYDRNDYRRGGGGSSASSMSIDPAKEGGWRNYSKTRWLEELDARVGSSSSSSHSPFGSPKTHDASTSPGSAAGSPDATRDAELKLALSAGSSISAQETLQELTKKTSDPKALAAQFVDFRDGVTQTVFGSNKHDISVATVNAASNISELIPIPDAGIMACSTHESLKREQEKALQLLQHVQGTLASQMQEAGVAFSGHGANRQLKLNIAKKPTTGGQKDQETEAMQLAKELGPAYRSLQAPPSGPYWRFVTEHGSNSLYDELSTKRARVVQQLSSSTAQRHDLFDRIQNELSDQYVLREKMWGEYNRISANSFVDVADFTLKTEADLKNQRARSDQQKATKFASSKKDEDEDMFL